jgi:H+-translocating NAD(P) transhydrogenase subunit alpha
VLVVGAGVAGLAAIGAASSLGAIVRATDVRPEVAEQVRSLGGEYVAVPDADEQVSSDGYAREMSEDFNRRAAQMYAEQAKDVDIVITTALIPGRPVPKLITRAMIESMKPGSVIVDLAAERGGNTELTEPGKTAETPNGVKIYAPLNLAGTIAVNASSLYAKNLLAFLDTMIDKKEKTLAVNWDDDLIKGTLIAKDGRIVHPNLATKSP